MEYFRKACAAFSPHVHAAAVQAAAQAVNAVKRQLEEGNLLASVRLPMKLTKEYRDKLRTQLQQKAEENKLFVQTLRHECTAREKRQRARQDASLVKLVTTLQAQAKLKPAVEDILQAERLQRLAEMKARREQRQQALQPRRSKVSLPVGAWTEKRCTVDLPELAKKKATLAKKRNIFLTSQHESGDYAKFEAKTEQQIQRRLLVSKQKHYSAAVKGLLKSSQSRSESPFFSPPKLQNNSGAVVGEAFGTPIGLDPTTLSAIQQRLAALNY